MSHRLQRILGASRVGSTHTDAGVGCQDAHGWLVLDDAVVIAVADGAGSRPRAHEGSRCAVEAALEFARSHEVVDETWMSDCFASARAAIDSYARSEDSEGGASSPSGFATTLAVMLITDEATLVGQVGDSCIVIESQEAAYQAVSPEKKSEYVNETLFITSDIGLESLRTDTFPTDEISAVALSTDGLRFEILDLRSGEPYEPFFDDVFAYSRHPDSSSPALYRFLQNLDDQSGDDLTLVVAVRGSLSESRALGPDQDGLPRVNPDFEGIGAKVEELPEEESASPSTELKV